MRKLSCAVILAGLILVPAAAYPGQGGNCSPEGTWYGNNTEGSLWIVTISRSGPNSYTTVMDTGANPPLEGVSLSTDWRGEMVKTGAGTYDWTTMAQLRTVEGFPFPLGLGFCPLTAEITGCDSWQGEGICSFYGFFSHDQDPFEEGFLFLESEPFEAFARRMPMTYPE